MLHRSGQVAIAHTNRIGIVSVIEIVGDFEHIIWRARARRIGVGRAGVVGPNPETREATKWIKYGAFNCPGRKLHPVGPPLGVIGILRAIVINVQSSNVRVLRIAHPCKRIVAV